MTEPHNASDPAALESLSGASAGLQTLRGEVRALRSLFSVATLALLLLSFGINAYLYYQDRIVRNELNAAKKMERDFEALKRPTLTSFIARLQDFARSHPDINPLLDKYGIRSAAPAPASSPSPSKDGK